MSFFLPPRPHLSFKTKETWPLQAGGLQQAEAVHADPWQEACARPAEGRGDPAWVRGSGCGGWGDGSLEQESDAAACDWVPGSRMLMRLTAALESFWAISGRIWYFEVCRFTKLRDAIWKMFVRSRGERHKCGRQ